MSGSNPNADVNNNVKWKTEYRVERWYPEFYDAPRPSNAGLPRRFTYGGNGFSLNFGSADQAAQAKVVLVRTGFSTHGMNMGQRMIELKSSRQGSRLSVAQLPPNPNLFAPGPALAFVVINGVPSQGIMVMVGNGQIGKQPVAGETQLPATNGRRDVEEREVVEERAVSDDDLIRSGVHARSHKTSNEVFEQDRSRIPFRLSLSVQLPT